MSTTPASRLALIAIALALSACAAAVPGYTPDLRQQQAEARAEASRAAAGTLKADGTYELGPEELALDCKKLSGRMQVRILQLRDAGERKRSTDIARGLQTASNAAFGGSSYGTDPDGEHRRDRAILNAYNRQLAAKGCKTYDLDAELRPKPVTETPRPVESQKKQ